VTTKASIALALGLGALLPTQVSADQQAIMAKDMYEVCKIDTEVAQAMCNAYMLGALEMADVAQRSVNFRPCMRPDENSDTMKQSFMLQMKLFPKDGENHTAAQIIAAQIGCRR
jgi:hypothetical protein